jgi:CheY-like chemotaxis protein
MDGFAFSRLVHANERVPVMLVSILKKQAEAILRGVAGYVQKPVTAAELRAAVDRVLGAAADVKILVVDDDPDQRAVAAELLTLVGYEVVVACDGHDALDLLRAGLRPRVIVLDLAMPRMSGWAFLERLRGPERSSVPVVVTSGDVGTRRPEGADLCLEKPIDPSELRSAVARLDAARPALVPDG